MLDGCIYISENKVLPNLIFHPIFDPDANDCVLKCSFPHFDPGLITMIFSFGMLIRWLADLLTRRLADFPARCLALSLLVLGSCAILPKPQCVPMAYARLEVNPATSAGYFEIFTRSADGCVETRLTNNPGLESSGPSWSPDGSKIAYSSRVDGNAEIYVMNADGSGKSRRTHHLAEDTDPDWSPDGMQIAFTRMEDGIRSIFVMNTDGSGPKALTTQNDYQPDWSPDGTRVAFVSERGGLRRIFVMNADGSLPFAITASGNVHSPVWSPDGTRIAYVSNNGVWVKDFFGINQPVLLVQGAEDPAWSPDGASILFAGLENGRYRVYLIQADSTGQRVQFDVGNSRVIDLAWRPGG